MDDGSRASRAERKKRASGKAKRWLSKVVPAIECCAQTPNSREEGARGRKQKKPERRRGCFSESCCWCACNSSKKMTSQKQMVDSAPARGGDWYGVLEVMSPRRRKDADHALDFSSPTRDAAIAAAAAAARLPLGPAREFPLPDPLVGQEAHLKAALSYLADEAVRVVGVCGAGGVGKTTFLRSINNQFCSDAGVAEFDHVILVGVGKDPDVRKLQRDIAYEVGLLLRDDDSDAARAAAILAFLKPKSYLLLLDDLWAPLELAKVGIPQLSGDAAAVRRRQKLILSSRLRDIAGKMQAHKILTIECLKWEDSWVLFKSKVGEDTAEDRRIKTIAVALAKECGGLPLALAAMGSAMAAKRNLEEWQKAISLLRNSPLRELSGMEDESLALLQSATSESLRDRRTSECLLSCSLWPKGYQMLKENLIRSWLGFGSIEDFDDINEAYNTGHAIIESLRAASLLENSGKSHRRLEMHEVIREMALWIGSEEGGKNRWLVGANAGGTRSDEWSTAERVSLMFNDIQALPESCYCPSLRSLILRGNKRLSKIPNGLLPCLIMLTYLDVSHTSIHELPEEIGTLVNLQLLDLSYTKIASLPEETKGLASLKHLELEGTAELRRIPRGVISLLERLQSLNLYMSGFTSWNWLPATATRGRDGVSFEELGSLPRLRSLGFTVRNIPSLLRLFGVRGASTHSLAITELRGLISLHLLPALLSGSKMGGLKNLTVESSRALKELVMGEDGNGSPGWRLRQLEVLNLVCLPALERVVWRGATPGVCLPNLRCLSLFHCGGLRSVTWSLRLPLLEELYVQSCNEMEHVIAEEASSTAAASSATSFPKLKYIYLRDLKKLVSVNDQALELPCLERILVHDCSELKRLPLGVKSAERLRMVFGERRWWDNLQWEDERIRSIFASCFREIPAGYEPSMNDLSLSSNPIRP